jgi:pimeloyl-ACP methyl ester carboxylesterase
MLRHLTVDGHCLVAWGLRPEAPGTPTILLHGITHSIFFWAPDRTFAEYGPCYSLSLPDHFPARSRAADRPLSAERFADLLAGAVDELTGGAPANLVGVSTGGFAALALAARAPRLVRRVVCISGFARGRWIGLFGRLQALARSGPLGRAAFRAMFTAYLRTPAITKRIVRRTWADTTPRRSLAAFAGYPYFEEICEAMTPALFHLDHEAMLAAFGVFPDIDIGAWLPRIAAPTLVVYGDGDTVVPPSQGPLIAAAVPGAELLCFPGAGHLPHWEDYPRFRAEIGGWMRRTAAL